MLFEMFENKLTFKSREVLLFLLDGSPLILSLVSPKSRLFLALGAGTAAFLGRLGFSATVY